MAKQDLEKQETTSNAGAQYSGTGQLYMNDSHYVVLEQGKRILPDQHIRLDKKPLSKHLKKV